MRRVSLLFRRGYCSGGTRVSSGGVIWDTGVYGKLADGNSTVYHGKTVVFSSVICDKIKTIHQEGLPLQVEHREIGIQKSEPWTRREGIPEDSDVLVGRTVHRALRPLFPPLFSNDLTVTTTALAVDPLRRHHVVEAIHAASAALTCSDVPWNGPVGACMVAYVQGDYITNPTNKQISDSRLVLVLSATQDRVLALEATAKEAEVESIKKALDIGLSECKEMIECQKELRDKVKVAKREGICEGVDPIAAVRILELAKPLYEELYSVPKDKAARSFLRRQIKSQVEAKLTEYGAFRHARFRVAQSGSVTLKDLEYGLEMTESRVIREKILNTGHRPDGRLVQDMRQFSCESGVLPGLHGSAVFNRGETQSLCTVLVGSDRELKQLKESDQRLVLSYRNPSYAVGMVTKKFGTTRRERGHSALAERALLSVMPDPEIFPFPVKIVATTMASTGSSSMAAVCGGSLALLDAGVPITDHVAGVSFGLVTDFERNFCTYELATDMDITDQIPQIERSVLITDLLGLEDAHGDMDFKIAGTKNGITALQLDVKIPGGVEIDIIHRALDSSKKPLEQLIDGMSAASGAAMSSEDSDRPYYETIPVDGEVMGVIIGRDGDTVRKIEEKSGAQVMLPSEDRVYIYGPTQKSFDTARTSILDVLGLNIHEGEIYSVKVVNVLDYGAYVELPNGFQALLHISQLAHERINAIEDVLSDGEYLNVKCIGRDDSGNIILSRKALLEKQPL